MKIRNSRVQDAMNSLLKFAQKIVDISPSAGEKARKINEEREAARAQENPDEPAFDMRSFTELRKRNSTY